MPHGEKSMLDGGGPPLVCAESDGAILRLRLNNPPVNALSLETMEALLAALASAREDQAVRVIVIGASGKLFSAGHDLKQMSAHRADPDGGEAYFTETFAACSRLMREIVEHPLPVIAEVDGIATAAGCQLVASCDLAFASDRARFGVNGIDVGLFCTTPSVALTRAVSAKRAMEMLLTGEMIDAATAREFGLVNRVVPSDALTSTVEACARLIASKSPLAVKLGKAAVRKQAGLDLAAAYGLSSRVMVENMLADDAKVGIAKFLGH